MVALVFRFRKAEINSTAIRKQIKKTNTYIGWTCQESLPSESVGMTIVSRGGSLSSSSSSLLLPRSSVIAGVLQVKGKHYLGNVKEHCLMSPQNTVISHMLNRLTDPENIVIKWLKALSKASVFVKWCDSNLNHKRAALLHLLLDAANLVALSSDCPNSPPCWEWLSHFSAMDQILLACLSHQLHSSRPFKWMSVAVKNVKRSR